MKHTDDLLIKACLKGTQKAQLQLYKKYANAMFAVALRYMHDEASAEDAMQEAFIKAFEKLHLYKAEVAFGAWLKRIVINHCIDQLRKNKPQMTHELIQELPIADTTENWETEHEVALKDIMAAIALLPEKNRIVVQLNLIEEYSHREIADLLSITETNSRSLLYRGRMLLIEHLKPLRHGKFH